MSMIRSIHAREILDSRGNPTIEVRVHLSDKIIGTAQVPSGASTGIHEALELRDHDKKRYAGKGVLKAVNNVNSVIQKILLGKSVFDQRIIDELLIKLDATENKSHLGANAILGVSLACAHAGAKARSLPLYKYLREIFELSYESYSFPFATMNVLNGGAHAGWILDFQEFMIVPTQRSFKERVRCGSEIFHTLGALLSKKGYTTAVGDEGGYAVPFKKNEEALLFLTKAVREAGYIPGKNIFFALDPASSEFYDSKKKVYSLKRDGKQFTSEELISYYELLIKKYPIISLEDGLSEDDWQGWKEMTKRLGKKIALVGDDLFVTNPKRLALGIEQKAGNAILIKLNQIGTLSETIDAILMAQSYKYKVSVSHRSGETTDTTIADLSVAVNAQYIKTGSLSRSERLVKYNRLMEIEEELSSN